MRIARLLLRSASRPRVALERDGALYDVEALERALGGVVDVPGDPSDFHTRVVAMGTAGLRELDAMLLQGRRPGSARVDLVEHVPLPPCDTERAAYVHVDVRLRAGGGPTCVRLGSARGLSGQDALVDLPRGEGHPDVEVSLGVLVGDDLRDATRTEARAAIVGYTVLVDWCARDHERARVAELSTTRGLRAQLGPWVVAASSLGRVEPLRVELEVGGRRFDAGALSELGLAPDEAVAFASSELPLAAGDVVGIGPLPRGVASQLGCAPALHEPVRVTIERLGTLRGAAVPRR